MPLVDLDARAIELPLEGRGPERAQCIGDAVCRLREHRRHGLHRPQRVLVETPRTAGQRCMRDARDAVRDHRRLAHRRGRQRRGLRDGVDHQRLQRALAQLAKQQANEKVALVGGRACEQCGQEGRALRLRARARRGRDTRERGIDIEDRQRRRVDGGVGLQHRESTHSRCRFVPAAFRRQGRRRRWRSRPARACAGIRPVR